MRALTRFVMAALGAAGAYMLFLVAFGLVGRGCVKDRIEQRMAESMAATVDIGELSVSLVGGTVVLTDVAVTRPDGGHLELAIEHIEVELAPLGWSIIDRTVEHAQVRGARMSISAMGALDMPRRQKRTPVVIDEMHLENLQLVAMPTAVLPGLGRSELGVERAVTGRLELSSAIDWIFAVRELSIVVSLPGKTTAALTYRDGILGASGSLFGSTALSVPFTMPVPEPGDLEVDKLRVLVGAIVKVLGAEVSRALLEDQVKDRVRQWLD